MQNQSNGRKWLLGRTLDIPDLVGFKASVCSCMAEILATINLERFTS